MRAKIPVWVDRMHRMGKFGRFGILPLMAAAAVLLASGGNILAGADHAKAPAPSPLTVAKRKQIQAATAKLPLRFEENVGQVKGPEARDVRFISRGSEYSLFLTSKEAVLSVQRHAGDSEGKTSPAVLRMRLAGANPLPQVAGQAELPGRSNYLIGNDPTKWHTGVANYSRVAENGVYPGIDLVYHGNQGQLEYDFDVAPKADPKIIHIAFNGNEGLRVDDSGNLLVKVAGGDLMFRKPVAYQADGNGSKRFVPVQFALNGKNQVKFGLASYDRSHPLVIDPILSYSTYIGGTSIDAGNGIAVAPDGTAFIAGGTFSTDFPTAGTHPLQPNDGGSLDFPKDAFVTKISADGSTLLYSTYLGGTSTDVANGIAVDAAGEAFVVGTTISGDFPITFGSVNTLCGADGQCGSTWNPQGFIVSNAFVSKLNTAGSGLVYSTFLGEYENVEGYAIAVDGALNAYVTGTTSPNFQETVPLIPPAVPPPPFPITASAFEKTYNNQPEDGFGICTTGSICNGTNAFIVKIDAPGDGILYSSYLGGDNTSYGYGIAVDTTADAYITGLTYSDTGFPITGGNALQVDFAGAGDAFLTKVDTTGSGSPLYSTFLGGTGIDQANAVAVDASGNAYITGGTTSVVGTLGFTPPAGGFQTNCTLDTLNVCEGDAFVAKINPTLSGAASLLYFTYLGGSFADSGTGIAVDAAGDAFIAGKTVSTDFPIAARVFQPVYGGGNADAFVSELNPTAAGLIYSTYLGGTNTDTAAGIGIDLSGAAYVTGQTCSLDFPLANPEQPTSGGNCDAFIAKIIQSGGVSLSPTGLIFSSENVGQQSAAQTVTLTNDANVALAISSIAVSGNNSTDFAIQTNTCGTAVPANSTCTISVTFKPTSTTPATRTAEISFVDTETGGSQETQVLDLTGTAGAAPIVTLSTNELDFSTQSVGVASTAQILTVSNTGTAALNISSIVASGNFAVQSNTCTVPLQATTPASNCTVSVTFTPNVAGQSVGSLTLTDNASDSPEIVLLTGTGALQASVSIAPTSLTFGSQVVGSTSSPQIITVTNTGTAPLTFGLISASSGFGETNTCGAPVAPSAICTISVTFTPNALGSNTGALTINDSAPNSPQLVPLTGGGSDFAVALSAGSSTVVAGNTATLTVSVSSVAGYNSPVALSCSGLPTLATCSISPSTVTPSASGPATATLKVTTTRRSAAPPVGMPRLPGSGLMARPLIWILAAMLLLAFGTMAQRASRLRWSWALLALTALWLASFAACGAGGQGYSNPTGTPAGTYTITVTGTSAGLTHSTNFTLQVQ
jgi:hypothetical protein